MNQRVVQALDNGLVQLCLAAAGNEVHAAAKLVAQVPDETLELGEGCAYGDHPDAHGVVVQLRGQAFHYLRNACECGIFALKRGLAQARLHGDKLSHQVYQAVQFLRGHTDGGGHALGMPGLLYVFYELLLAKGALHRALLHKAGVHQQCAYAFLAGHNALQLFLCNAPSLYKYHTELLVVRVLGEHAAFVYDVDAYLSVVLHEDEDVTDGVDPHGGGEYDVPGRVAGLRVQFVQGWYVRDMGGYIMPSHAPEFVKKIYRVNAP